MRSFFYVSMDYHSLKHSLLLRSSKEQATKTKRFFKTGPGDYSENDIFIGVSNPEIRKVAKCFREVLFLDVLKLLKSPIHEERLLSLIILINKYKEGSLNQKEKIFKLYWENSLYVNNWDLVDLSAPTLMGEFCLLSKNHSIMDKFISSHRHWDRRIAIVSTLSFIRNQKTELTYTYAKKLLCDQEDLMHKACGWMLREAGKRDMKELRSFIRANGSKMPRTMLRYAIEKFDENERKKILSFTKMAHTFMHHNY